MEGLIFFIAMIVFIVRTVNKIKKAASGGKKGEKIKSRNKSHVKDKLEELIRNMEEAERLKKEGKAGSPDEEFISRSALNNEDRPGAEKASFSVGRDSEISPEISNKNRKIKDEKILYDRISSVKYDIKDNIHDDEFLKKEADELTGKNQILKSDSGKAEKKKSAVPGTIYSVSGVNPSAGNGRGRQGILNSVLKYPELQRAVILKEILDSPVSEKY